MVKLSILIAAGNDALLEATLVSVLQSRPAYCEVIVVCDDSYADPYALSDEVRFVRVPKECDELGRLNRGLPACRGTIVHVLRCGAEVREGWCDPVVQHFSDPRVAAVAPLVVEHARPSRIDSAGIDYRPGGARIARMARLPEVTAGTSAKDVLGATLTAGYFRRSYLGAHAEFFAPVVGENADVDLALRLAREGYRAVFEPRSRVVAAPAVKRRRPLSEAWSSERLFWRHLPREGRIGALASHLTVWAAEAAASVLNPLQAVCVVGRLAGLVEQVTRGNRIAPAATISEADVETVDTILMHDASAGAKIKHRTRHNASRAA